MNVREATTEDADAVKEIAERSFRASYSLSPQEIDAIVDGEFSREAYEERVDDPDVTFLVAEEPDEPTPELSVSGFAEFDADDVFRWLHVHPDARGRGVGSALLEQIHEVASDRESFRAVILEDATEGDQFLQRVGLSRTGGDELEIGGQQFHVQLYELTDVEQSANEPSVEVPDNVEHEGSSLTVESDDISGTLAPFFPLTDDGEPAGYFCSQCGTTEVSAGSLDRLECSECGNLHRADEWDSAYL